MDPASTNLNLAALLQKYENLLTGEKTEDADNFSKYLMNIIATKSESLNKDESDALQNFSNRLLTKYPKDKVVQLTTYLANSIVLKKQKADQFPLPEDILKVIRTFSDVSSFRDLPQQKRIEAATFASQRLMIAGSPEYPIKYDDLVQFVKVITVCWSDPFFKPHQEAVTKRLSELIPSSSTVDPDAVEFTKLAMTLIKDIESQKVPKEIAENPAYHGKALEIGIATLQSVMQEKGTVTQALQDFALRYSENHLKPGQYLFRNSSTVPSKDADGTRSYTIAMSYKTDTGEFNNIRLTRYERADGKVYWKTPMNNDETLSSLKEVVAKYITVKGYKPSLPPREHEVIAYVKMNYI